MTAQNINDSLFDQEVLESDKPVLVDFWAPWCGPCKTMLPIVDSFAANNPENIKVVKVSIDENAESAKKYGIRSIPSLLLFKNGEVISNYSGGPSEKDISEWVNKAAAN